MTFTHHFILMIGKVKLVVIKGFCPGIEDEIDWLL